MTSPARITIELEAPRHARGRWRARTRVDGQLTHHDGAREFDSPMAPAIAPVVEVVEVMDSREPAVVPAYEPAAYEAAECTCIEGWCDTDHANE